MGHAHAHGHGVGHRHGSASSAGGPTPRFALTASIGANGVLLVVQVVVGVAIGSLSLLADSLHNASDVVALVVALVGQVLAARPATDTRTYGYARTEVLAALLNGAVLLAVTGWVVVEAVGRFGDPPEVASTPLLVIGLVGIAVNGGSALLVARSGSSLNLRAAFWHLAGDALGSLGVVVAALAIAAFGAYWADPAASLAISVLVVVAVVGVLRDAIAVLLESVPRGIDTAEVRTALEHLDGVTGVHHLHVWALDSETSALTAHLQMEHGTDLHRAQERSNEAAALLRTRFGIGHATLQVECDDGRGHVPIELGPRRGGEHA
jgi:cobalt-zinc-cadmium efflux system protein